MSRLDELKKLAAGPVVLTQDGVNAHRKVCHAGTVIAPHIEGWPEHRVVHHLLQKMAEPTMETQSATPAKARKEK